MEATMAREKSGEELLSSINEDTTAEEFELLFTHSSNHISGFQAEQSLSGAELGRLLDSVWEAIQIKIDGVRDPVQLRRRFEDALENMRRAGGPIRLN
jgi:hypothetical protein